jgi:diguanylate cyclase (GGDEF)-like protein
MADESLHAAGCGWVSTTPPSPLERRLALGLIVGSSLLFAALAPNARTAWPPAPAFIAGYQSALALNDLVTAALLYGQCSALRSRALLLLAAGYVFTAGLAIVHALTFPGLFAAHGLLGAGMQTTAWLYMLWHGGFPLAVIGYRLLSGTPAEPLPAGRSMRAATVGSVLAAAALALACTLLTTVGEPWLPVIMDGPHYTPAMTVVVGAVWLGTLASVGVLWHRSRSALDLWLTVVMCAWFFDIGLSAVVNGGRFDLGFYTGRAYGLFASAFVMLMLLGRVLALYGRLAATHEALSEAARHDSTTGLFNRRWFDESLHLEMLRAARERQPISLLIADVDHFKRINDTHGHLVGDACLRSVASAVASAAGRPGDLVARIGGEEFAVLLPSTDQLGAREVAERLRLLVAAHVSTGGHPLTVSVGAATLWPRPTTAADELVGAADGALYAAKRGGRNRVEAATLSVALGPSAAAR